MKSVPGLIFFRVVVFGLVSVSSFPVVCFFFVFYRSKKNYWASVALLSFVSVATSHILFVL